MFFANLTSIWQTLAKTINCHFLTLSLNFSIQLFQLWMLLTKWSWLVFFSIFLWFFGPPAKFFRSHVWYFLICRRRQWQNLKILPGHALSKISPSRTSPKGIVISQKVSGLWLSATVTLEYTKQNFLMELNYHHLCVPEGHVHLNQYHDSKLRTL